MRSSTVPNQLAILFMVTTVICLARSSPFPYKSRSPVIVYTIPSHHNNHPDPEQSESPYIDDDGDVQPQPQPPPHRPVHGNKFKQSANMNTNSINYRGNKPQPPATTNPGPERGQILHRPKNGEKYRDGSSTKRQAHSNYNHNNNQNHPQMPDNGPIILHKGKAVKYLNKGGRYQSNSNSNSNSNSAAEYSGPGHQNSRPQIYVINAGGEEEEDQGMMGSMQSYFKSMTGRIKSAMQGLIGGVSRR